MFNKKERKKEEVRSRVAVAALFAELWCWRVTVAVQVYFAGMQTEIIYEMVILYNVS